MNPTASPLFRQQAYIDGQWLDAADGARQDIFNPATGACIGQVPNLGAAEARQAIEAAERAWPAWRALTAKERSARLKRWHALMIEHTETLAQILTLEQGKPLAEARGEIVYAASFIEWFAEEAKRIYGDTIPSHKGDARIVVTKEPIGVVAAITPWNFPAAMITRKAGPALAAGCPCIVKPAPETPFSALALAALAEQAGIPAGVFNVITGDAVAIGGELTASPAVRKLSFTGSTAIGKLLMAQCAPTLKKVSLELGGNAPFIVFDDADLERAVEGALVAKFRNAGQTCVCVNRFLVQDGIHDAFVARLAERVAQLKVGSGFDEGVTQGPLINERAVAKVEDHVRDALAQGARLLCGGERHPLGHGFYPPTVLAEVNTGMKVAREETFGPLAAVFRFHDEAEAVRLANDTEFGLAAYCYTRDLGRAWRMSEALEYGMVGINEGLISTEVAPFGGIKASGLGREGSHYGIEDYLEIKYTLMGGL
ncbi:NAD-dependent succinate-semialdehyde dehydrogenase [Metapseudomonas otitidis]|jgi:succinate-semialdehyde dehydrogenase/glutarate-semialdehyde dehydrogenase|uniref:NAD-dependent succinate-semialdehyde dehydrogenase n=1 Tax=Metapseudomonas otitidis TaxID=319939 RepID=UPI000D1B0005|nr:NAD-dependent succinate-semialdehyde dehydrogenase [Pseudomonas otitidis]MDH0339432.1 NAD-dependent succinate-semialdehyde dehydrogenase [Pseudomonas otitidis]MDH1105626.1 NAD-dependent succinate-semialdehyde dehydrogenase [Pseudomonas otitidis]MDH1159032.1 NAD-dependent succinate-semialdehyde dehydrogenase [Pseudomonas otitidis]MDH1167608.1 NAD-dependent succinate-semialdehyde dehydrogenase [Pseudomonas otitidis]MEE1895968.1 NAD-dependent succinate-semialdehyde dehydrogenase [Pseudomonas o